MASSKQIIHWPHKYMLFHISKEGAGSGARYCETTTKKPPNNYQFQSIIGYWEVPKYKDNPWIDVCPDCLSMHGFILLQGYK